VTGRIAAAVGEVARAGGMTDLDRRLALAVIAMAQHAGMPDSYWSTDRMVGLARAVLGWTPEEAQRAEIDPEDVDHG
jgi:hypothetical protein